MKTVISNTVPDSTYFRTGDAEPVIDGDVIVLTEGRGSRRSWGAPQVNNTVVVDTCDFLAVLTGFSHKHGGGQFWRYFVETPAGEIERRTWSKLTDDEQQMVLDGMDKAPSWAKNPGKLRADYVKPAQTAFVGHKVLRVADDARFLSLYDETEWEIGKRNGQAVAKNAGTDEFGYTVHDGGFYVHPDANRVIELWAAGTLAPERCYVAGQEYALVRCECSGRVREFSSGKRAVTYCKPLEIVDRFTL